MTEPTPNPHTDHSIDHGDCTGVVTLGIEMSNPASAPPEDPAHTVALWAGTDDAPPLIASAPLPTGARASDALMDAVRALCADNAIAPARIARIIVSTGPGGYTALRIATTTAKMLALTLGAELIAVPSARVVALGCTPRQCPALIALASKKDRVHASIARDDGRVEEVGIIESERLASLGVRSIIADRHLPDAFDARARALGIARLPLRLDARELLRASVGLGVTEPLLLQPRYAREPDAVTQWRARGSG